MQLPHTSLPSFIRLSATDYRPYTFTSWWFSVPLKLANTLCFCLQRKTNQKQSRVWGRRCWQKKGTSPLKYFLQPDWRQKSMLCFACRSLENAVKFQESDKSSCHCLFLQMLLGRTEMPQNRGKMVCVLPWLPNVEHLHRTTCSFF